MRFRVFFLIRGYLYCVTRKSTVCSVYKFRIRRRDVCDHISFRFSGLLSLFRISRRKIPREEEFVFIDYDSSPITTGMNLSVPYLDKEMQVQCFDWRSFKFILQ